MPAPPRSPGDRALPSLFRWLVIASTLAGLAIRAYAHRWDPSLFLQLVFVIFGFGFSGSASRMRADRDDPVHRAILGLAVVMVCVVIVTSAWLTVPTMAPFAVMVIALVWAMLLRQFRTPLFVVPLLCVGPLLFWAWHALHQGDAREAILRVRPADLLRVEMHAPDGSRTEVLASDEQRAEVTAMLARAVPLYPNHEGLTDAWRMHLVFRDGTSRDLLLGHGSRSRSNAWLEFDSANDFSLPETLESVIARLVPDPARASCEATVRAVCELAAQCNPTGTINLLIPREGGGEPVISTFSDRSQCVPSYLHRRCDPGGFVCAPGEPPRCVDLNAALYGTPRAVQVPSACADVFRERR